MNALLSNFVSKVQTKHWQNLQRKTQKLDPVNRENLLDFLEDNLPSSSGGGTRSENLNDKTKGSKEEDGDNDDENDWIESSTTDVDEDDDDDFAEEDYELLQRDLDKANTKLEELQSKRDFLQTRLQTYQSKINAAEESMSDAKNAGDSNINNNNNIPKISVERLVIMKEKIENYKTSLQPVQDIYELIEDELSSHQHKIESMQNRQLELKLKTQECKVVLDELSYYNTTTTRERTLVPNEGDAETSEQLGLIESLANATDCSSLGDEQHPSNNSDVENARIKEKQEIVINKTAKDSAAGSLSIPIGTHLEIEPRQKEEG